MMSLRRQMMGVIAKMAQSGNLPSGYVAKTISITTAITNAKQLADLLESELSGFSYAEGFTDRDWATTPATNNYLCNFIWSGSTSSPSVWMRYRNNTYNYNSIWTSSYDLNVDANSNILVIAKQA